MTDPQRPRTERGHALIEAVRGAVLDPAIATLLGSDGKQELVALVSLALLEADIPAIEAEASIAAPAGLREMLDEAESIIRQGTETAWLRLGYYRWQDVANDWLKRRAPLEAAPRSPEPPRRMLDGSPCWCVSEDEPHEGWVHAPVCLVRREIAADPNRRAHVEAVKVELAASCSSCGHLLAAHPLCCPDDMHLTADGKRLVWWDAAPRSPEPCQHEWEPITGVGCFRCDSAQFVRAASPETPEAGIDALRALSEAATPGPWERVTEGHYDQRHAAAAAFLSIMATRVEDNPDIEFSDVTYIRAGWPNVAMVGNGPKQTKNGDFIVAAVNYVRARLASREEGERR